MPECGDCHKRISLKTFFIHNGFCPKCDSLNHADKPILVIENKSNGVWS